jgi:uncharacterized protein YbaR (Trm112 family)
MAYLVKCRVCGGNCSSEANTCPHCGDPWIIKARKEEHDIDKKIICPLCKRPLSGLYETYKSGNTYCTNEKCSNYVDIVKKREAFEEGCRRKEEEHAERRSREWQEYLYWLGVDAH